LNQKREVFRAIERGETNQVKDFITKNILKLDDTDEFGNTLLNVAAQYGCYETCNLLCRAGANINRPNNLGNTPLHHANEYKHMKLVDLLVENMADESIKNGNKKSPWEGI
jgi:ankyrin repeat protein